MPPEEPPGSGKHLSTPHANGQRGALLAKKKKTRKLPGLWRLRRGPQPAPCPRPGPRPLPSLAHPGKPCSSTKRAPPALPHPSEVLPPLDQHPAHRPGLQRGAPILSVPRAPGAGPLPFPHSPRLARVHPASRGERARVASRHPRLQERYSRLRAGVGGTHRTYLLYVHLSAPLAGEKVSPPRSNSATAGSGEEPSRPLPRSAARSPPAKQNGGAREGGVRASDGTTLAFLTKRRGSRGRDCSLLLAKGAFYGVCRWISFDAFICS